MRAAVIGASEEALHTIEKAHEYGLAVDAFDGNPDAAGLKAADRACVVDISNEEETIRAVQASQPDFILTVPIGRYLTTIGAVNDALGLPGISRQTAVLCTDKYLFHELLAAKGLRSCYCCLSGNYGKEGHEWEFRYPAILKPRFGSGSRGIHPVRDERELTEAMGRIQGEDYVLEECIEGEEYGLDAAVTDSGFHMILLRRKINTPLPARQAIGYFSVVPSEETGLYMQIESYMTKVLQVLGIGECLLHADIIYSETGPFAVELSARPSGHNLHNLFTPLATGIDMAEEYIRYRMGKAYCFCPDKTKKMLIHYFDRQGTVTNVPSKEQLEALIGQKFTAYRCNLLAGDRLEAVTTGHSIMGRGYFVLEGSPEEKLKEQAWQVEQALID